MCIFNSVLDFIFFFLFFLSFCYLLFPSLRRCVWVCVFVFSLYGVPLYMRYSVWFLGKIWFSGAHFHWRMNLISLLCKSWGSWKQCSSQTNKQKKSRQPSNLSQQRNKTAERENFMYIYIYVCAWCARACMFGCFSVYWGAVHSLSVHHLKWGDYNFDWIPGIRVQQ